LNPVVLEASNIKKSFGGVRALKGVSLELQRGEVHALAGENGAGKSTLIKILAGALEADSGEIRLNGQRVENNSPEKARALGVGIVYQQPALFPDLSVAENIALAGERKKPWGRVNWRERREHALTLLQRVGARIHPDALAGELTIAEQQLVEIAKALDATPQVLILDEPTAALGEQDAENLFRIVADLKAQQTTIVYITHRFEELFRLADRVTVLRDGNSIETRSMTGVTKNELIRLMVGRELTAVFPDRLPDLGKTLLEVRALSSRSQGVKNVTLTLRQGEILGMAGLIGSGRTQFAEALFGLAPVDSGDVLIESKPVHIRSAADSINHGIAYVPEDRRKHGLVLKMPIAANTTLASLSKISSGGLLQFVEEHNAACDFSKRMSVKAPSVDCIAGNLSGGNQQKVALARWLMTEPKILILDEPTQGIDVGAKTEIYSLISELAERGMGIIMISSDMTEIMGMSDRILVMAKGEVAGVLDRCEATPEMVLELALGHPARVLEGQGV
jgi:rhamnose transport system ATP-binding protein